jgi:hypothetical protein
MNRFILTAAAVAFTFVISSGTSVQAEPIKTTSTTPKVQPSKTVNNKSVRVTFHLRDFRGWNSYCWFSQYRCYGYYCSADQQWFYWYEPMARFLPIRYMAQYPPTALRVAPINTVTPTAGTLPTGANPTPPAPLPTGGSPIQGTPPMPTSTPDDLPIPQ